MIINGHNNHSYWKEWQFSMRSHTYQSHMHACIHCQNIHLQMCTCTGICIAPTATLLGDNCHTHLHAHLPSPHESAFQNKNCRYAAAIISRMDNGLQYKGSLSFIRKNNHCQEKGHLSNGECGPLLTCFASVGELLLVSPGSNIL